MTSKIKPIVESKQWMFHYDNQSKGLPFVDGRKYTIIKQSIFHNPKSVENRIKDLEYRGFEVKRCYVPTYNGVGNLTYMPRLNEIRIIIGRPKNHFCKEVYAVIIKPKARTS